MARNPFSQSRAGDSVVVIGLGRFGSAVAKALNRQGVDVLGVDLDPRRVAMYADDLTHVVQADATDDDALRQLGVGDFSQAVVAIGSGIEASVIITLSLVQLGIQDIWAKAISDKHGAILSQIGAHHVVFPEVTIGEQVASLMSGSMTAYMQFEGGYVIGRTFAPREAWGKTLAESALRGKYEVTVVGLKRPGEDFSYARPETFVAQNDELVVAGLGRNVEKFCALP